MINCIQNKSLCLDNMCVYFVYLLCIYKYTHIHVQLYIYIYICVCVCIYMDAINRDKLFHSPSVLHHLTCVMANKYSVMRHFHIPNK